MSELFLVEEKIKIVHIRIAGRPAPAEVPKVWWLSRHYLESWQKKVIARLDGNVDVHHLTNFWELNYDDFADRITTCSNEGIVYVVGPRDWLEEAASAGLSFRKFHGGHDSIGFDFKCVYEYKNGVQTRLLGAHQLR